MGYRDLLRMIGLFVISGVAFGSSAKAAPQILAVLATDTAIPFTCEDGLCSAELSTYCLQRDRPKPHAGSVYLPAEAKDFILGVKTASGKIRNLPSSPYVTFREARGFLTITAVIEARQLKRLGSLDATIRIGEYASLIPVPEEGDPNPLTKKEIAYVTGSLRKHGQNIVDKDPQAFAARLLTRVLNQMHDQGPAQPGLGEKLWRESVGNILTGGVGFDQARKTYDDCFAGPEMGAYGVGVRHCLEFRHDEMMRTLNINYWDTQPNS